MATITIDLDDDTQKILAKLVEESGDSESDIIARAIHAVKASSVTQVFGPKGAV